MFESMSDGIAGLVGLALSLARIPPRLPRFCPLSHRRCRHFVRVASVGKAAVSGFGFSSRQRPCSFLVVNGNYLMFVHTADLQNALAIIYVFPSVCLMIV